jgi:hypothetical protein
LEDQMRGILAAVAWVSLTVCATAQTLRDNFDFSPVDTMKWQTRQVRLNQVRFFSPGRCGAAAIAVAAKQGDGGTDCGEGEDCQRAELRTNNVAWPPYDGRDVWFSFSFRVNGSVPATGSARTVIGQWKAPGDDSPIVAQRFDNGVFHITVQDKDRRRVIAQAEGDPDKTRKVQQLLAQLDPNNADVFTGIKSLRALFQLRRDVPGLSGRFLSNNLLGALSTRIDNRTSARDLARELKIPSEALVSAFGDLAFVAEPERYVGAADIEITPESNRLLPDPRRGLVDMVYRIRGGRTDNEYGPRSKGEVEVWANGQKIVSVRGNVGYVLRVENRVELIGPYFKFGVYRTRIPGELELQFDEFTQTTQQSDLPEICSKQ